MGAGSRRQMRSSSGNNLGSLITLLGFAPTVGFPDLVAWNQTTPAATATEPSPVVADAIRVHRSHDAAILENAGYCAAHETVQFQPNGRPRVLLGWVRRGGAHAGPAYPYCFRLSRAQG